MLQTAFHPSLCRLRRHLPPPERVFPGGGAIQIFALPHASPGGGSGERSEPIGGPSPLRGRWHDEVVTDEVAKYGSNKFTPHQSPVGDSFPPLPLSASPTSPSAGGSLLPREKPILLSLRPAVGEGLAPPHTLPPRGKPFLRAPPLRRGEPIEDRQQTRRKALRVC